MSLHHFQRNTLPATPWKNGGGSTCEIACWPPGADLVNFDWRISIASIAADGPFSAFPGVDRSIMLLEGAGVRLRSSEGRFDHQLDTPYRPFAFSGDATVDCTLLGGPSSDFNVMTRRGRWRAELRVLDRAASLPPSWYGVLLALRGNWRLGEGLPTCHEGEGLCWTAAPLAWRADPEAAGARLVIVRFQPAQPDA